MDEKEKKNGGEIRGSCWTIGGKTAFPSLSFILFLFCVVVFFAAATSRYKCVKML